MVVSGFCVADVLLQGDAGAASASYDAARQACAASSSSSSSSGVSERLRQEVTADVIMGQAQVGSWVP